MKRIIEDMGMSYLFLLTSTCIVAVIAMGITAVCNM